MQSQSSNYNKGQAVKWVLNYNQEGANISDGPVLRSASDSRGSEKGN